MCEKKQNISNTFLRSQSIILSGQSIPLSNKSREKYFSKYMNLRNEKKHKINFKNNKYSKIEIKKNKNKKSFSSEKLNKINLIKHHILSKKGENKEIFNRNKYYKSSKNQFNYNSENKIKKNVDDIYTNTSINNSINEKENINNNNFEKEINKNKLKDITKNFYNNKFSNKNINIPFHISNGIANRSNIINNIGNKYNLTTGNIINKNEILNLINRNYPKNIFSYATKLDFHSIQNTFGNEIDKIYNLKYSQKMKKHKKILCSIKKDNNFINKIFLNNEYDDYFDINSYRNNNKLLNKFNVYTKRETFIQSYKREKNVTKEILKSMKKSINKKPVININLNNKINNYNISSPKINEVNKSTNYINFSNTLNDSVKNYIKFNNNFSNYFNNSQLKNNNFSPILTDYNYNLSSEKILLKPCSCKTLSNIINSIHDKRKTNKFIKELNKNNKLYNSNKIIRFSFNKEKNELLNDYFFNQTKYRLNNTEFGIKENKINNFYKQSHNKTKKNNYIKKNKSVDNYNGKDKSLKSYKYNLNFFNKIYNNNYFFYLK